MEMFNCRFSVSCDSERLYTCIVETAKLDHELRGLKGRHVKGKSDKDVKRVWFRGTANVNHFPRGLGKYFHNLTELIIERGGLMEITKTDLRGLQGLVCLHIRNCQLEALPDNLFTEMTKLREVSFEGNQIEFASSKVFKTLLGRDNVRVNLSGNKNIGAWFYPGIENSLESLEELMELIDESCDHPTLPNFVPDFMGVSKIILNQTKEKSSVTTSIASKEQKERAKFNKVCAKLMDELKKMVVKVAESVLD